MSNFSTLANWGWQSYFQQQLTLEEWSDANPARIIAQHRSQYQVICESGIQTLPAIHTDPTLTVGDWILLSPEGRLLRVLDRASCFRRKAAGSRVSEQLIAANVDTVFIVCSLNDDFNLNRIERYLGIVHEAGVEPVVVLTKSDTCDESEERKRQVQALDNRLCIEPVNCLDPESTKVLSPWCRRGKTIAMLGSSGAGKSTLTNTLLGEQRQATAGIREDDSKGRHTTTQREIIASPNGTLILDTPGMRELQLVDCETGLQATFSDIEALSTKCRFSDCQHNQEPGCAVKAAIAAGEIDQRRLDNYRKLIREQALNAASLAERRTDDRNLTRYYRRVQKENNKLKQSE